MVQITKELLERNGIEIVVGSKNLLWLRQA